MSRKLMSLLCVTGLIAGGAVLVPGCGDDAGQPSRGSISAPRKGGGMMDTAGDNLKTKPGAKKGGGKAAP